MKKYFYNFNYRKLALVFVIVLMLGALTGCVSQETYEKPLNGFTDETNVFNWVLVWPIAWIMNFIGSLFNNSFAIALICTTLIVRLISWPIYMSTTNTTYKMQLAQPDIQRVQAKYAGRSDEASKRKMSQEIQAVYKKHGFNPLGCFTIVFQFPIFTAMYTVIKRITVSGGDLSLDNFKFLGFDLATVAEVDGELVRTATSILTGGLGNQIFCGFLTVLVMGSIFLQQHLSRKKPSYQKNIPNKAPNEMESTMKMMMLMSPLMMGFIASQDAGMALYWVVGNTFALVQSIYVRKRQEKKYYASNTLAINPKDLK